MITLAPLAPGYTEPCVILGCQDHSIRVLQRSTLIHQVGAKAACSTHHVCISCLTCWLHSLSLQLSQCCHCQWHLLALDTCMHTRTSACCRGGKSSQAAVPNWTLPTYVIDIYMLVCYIHKPHLLHDCMDDRILLLCRSMWRVQ